MANAYRGGRAGPPPRRRRGFLGALAYWALVLGVWGLILVAGFLAVFATGLPDTSKLYDVQRQPSITYLDRSGSVVAVRGSQFAPPANLASLPPYVPAAFVAIEDRQFYHHLGFNPWGMVRSAIYNLRHPGGALRGGSTITQQLARNLFLTPAQTYRRKAQELILADMAGAAFHQATDPRALSQSGKLRRRRLRHRGGLAALFRQAGRESHARRGRPACRRP